MLGVLDETEIDKVLERRGEVAVECRLLALGMRKSTRMGWYSANGGSPLAISMAVIPKDQISAL